MRKIGEISNEQAALVFGAALYVRGIENDVESEENGSFSIWVHNDEQRNQAVALLQEFSQTPNDPKWQSAAPQARKLRKEEEKADARRASHVVTRERMSYEQNFAGFALWPMVLGVLSMIATFLAGSFDMVGGGRISPEKHEWANRLQITRHGLPANVQEKLERLQEYSKGGISEDEAARIAQELWKDGILQKPSGYEAYDKSLPEIRSGEFWRLFTPMFIHFGLLHIVFNMMWLRDLGSFLQHRFGAAYFLIFVFASAAVSNLAQFYLGSNGPNFGGMSGVNYALFGFLWLRGKFDRLLLWRLNPSVVQTMLIWFVLCFTPLIPNVANAAHAAGLLFGCFIGFISAKLASRR